jgi:endoglucanase
VSAPTAYDELLRRLTEVSGVSGHEIASTELLRELLAPRVDEISVDALGNVFGRKSATSGGPARHTLMIAAHQDEIGLMVTGIEDGFLRITGVGGWDVRQLLAQPVLVHGREALAGVIGARPPHVLPADQQAKVTPMEELFVDLGRPADEVAALVRVGDVVTLRRATMGLSGGRWTGKAMDNRASVLAMLVALDELATLRHSWDVLAVATVQEEIGLRGAGTAAFGSAPTCAIALDVGFARQPGAGEVAFTLDGGPIIAFGPNIHPRMYEALTRAANALEMAYQVEPLPGITGTDAGAIQVAGSGVPCALVGSPVRYMHSAVEMVALKDVQRTGRLVAQCIAGLDDAFVAALVEHAGDWDDVPGEVRP